MARKSSQSREDTLTLIRAASFRMFGRYGYEGVSMQDVATAADITKAALYWHYSSKDDLYLDAFSQFQDIIRNYVFAHKLEGMDALMGIFSGVVRMLADPRINEGIEGYWMEPAGELGEKARRIFLTFETLATQRIAGFIDQAVASGQMKDVMDSQVIGRMVINIMEAAVMPLRRQESATSRQVIATAAYAFFSAFATSEQDWKPLFEHLSATQAVS